MKSKSLLFLFSFLIIAIFIIGFNSCKKVASEDLLKPELNTSFNAATAKEWYYGIFKKTTEWKNYYKNTNSKVALAGRTASALSVPKLPDWDHPSYRRAGDLEIVEFPLVKAYKDVSVASAGLSVSDQKRIAEASLTRIVFIKKGDKIDVREVDYIPDMESLVKMNFDLSGNTVNKLDKNFSGRLIIKMWDGTEIGRRLVLDGKIVKKGIVKKVSEKIGDKLNSNSNGNRQVCSTIRITEYERFCTPILNGDNIQTGEYCTEWTPTGFFWDEEYCYEVPDGDDCAFYGTCEPPSGDCHECEDEKCNMTEQEATVQIEDAISRVQVAADNISISTVDVPQFGFLPAMTRDKYYDWVFLTNGILTFKSHDHAVQEKGPDNLWRFVSLTHDGDSQSGSMVLIVVSYKIKQSIATISEQKFGARMILKPELKFEFACKGSPVYRYVNYECKNYWLVTD